MEFNYDELVNKSYFTDKNFSGKLSPGKVNLNLIPCQDLINFHYLTSFFLHLYSALYIELKKKETQYDYNINSFTNLINNLKIKIINSGPFSTLNDSGVFILNYNSITNSNLFYTNTYGSNISNLKPEFGTYPSILTSSTFGSNFLNTEIHKNNINSFNYDNPKIKEVIRQILTQTPENIIGFILYQKIFYNVILYNIDIQNSIRRNYINSSTTTLSTDRRVISDSANSIITNINLKINDNISNLNSIRNNAFSDKEFLIEKNQYRNKINIFNNLREDYAKTQDKLNISIKLYNHELTNYKKIKNYATYIIILLIIIMIFTIFLSIFPIFKNDTKNAIYIITFILLLIITYLYYINFKYIVLYEKFTGEETTELTSNKTLISSCTTISYNPNNFYNKNDNIYLYNTLLPKINEYSNSVSELFNDLRINIYTIGSKSYSQDANIIIYNVYLEKKRQLEINNIKLTNLFNMIEIIKKQTSYLFNFVFIIACLCLILLLGLVLYSSIPQLFTFIIILCIVLISILMIYFTFAIIQPTRMIANKNYWAITNPSKNTKGKL